MRICFISAYPPNHARLSEYAQNLVNELVNKPVIEKLYVLADKSYRPDLFTCINSKIEVLRVWQVDNFFSILSVMLCILKLRPDVVHFNVGFQSFGKSKLSNVAGLSLILISRILGFKVLAGLHTLAEQVDLTKVNVKPTVINRVGILMATKFVLSAQRVVVLVRSYADCLRTRYGHKGVRYIPHGASANLLPKVHSSKKIILLFGHMGPYKGLPLMLDAFNKLKKESSNIQLMIAGSNHPNFPNYLQNFMKTRVPGVSYLGYVPHEQLNTLFNSVDVVVLPYLVAPGTSGVFHLACSYGLPVVASNLPEIREMVADGAAAVLLQPGDVNALADGLLSIISDDSKAAAMSEQNLKYAQKESWSEVAEAYTLLYSELTK